MSDPTANLPPPSVALVNLAIADLTCYALLIPPTLYIIWRHGMDGMVSWSLFACFIGMRFVSDIWMITHKTDPLIPGAAFIMTIAGSIACISLTLLGVAYEINIILPYPRRWTEKIILGTTHVINTLGIAVGTYGGAPSATLPGGVFSIPLDRLGNILMLLVMFALVGWLAYSYRRIMGVWGAHPNAKPALYMLLASLLAIPFQVMRLVWGTVMAFDNDAALNPVMGTFAAQFILVFATQLGFAVVIVAGGLVGIPRAKAASAAATLDGNDVSNETSLRGIELVETGDESLIRPYMNNKRT